MSGVLIADIGATNARFALVGGDGRPTGMLKLRDDAFPKLESAIAHFLEQCGAHPSAAVLAIAAPITGDEIAMTNRAWTFRLSAVAARFGFSAICGINDFEAVAWSIPLLRPDELRPLGPARPEARGPRAVFGPGTGLGVAGLTETKAGWQVLPSEGGHASFGPLQADEDAVFARLREQGAPGSAEAVLCGPGIERLHRALHGAEQRASAAEIIASAHAGEPRTSATVALFVRLFGRFAGDVALMFRATGGVYLGGGVSRRIGALLDAPAFRAAFEHHPPYEDLLAAIPTTLITLDEPGLVGCAALARHLGYLEGQ